ncbi:MAG: methylcobamide--CoM methyltransferase MtbA [Candidatus Electrothrix sp. AR3]|nr:methylcobamide--CoM methyltransferase MtbA [Candidatus Electrothrix sp. AR3]
MTSMERVLTTLSHQEPDQVPLFLLLTMHGAKELDLSIREYFSKPKNVIEGQLRMLKKFRHDCLYPFFYASIEVEAFGGEVLWYEDGPPNSGAPILKTHADICSLRVPHIAEAPCLLKVLATIQALKKKVQDTTPIIGVVMSPFSLPVMQMGFSAYIQLMYEQPKLFKQLMTVNQDFCVAWANAQLQAGATAICYFDPLASPTITDRTLYLNTGFQVAQQTLARIKGPTATHLASGHCLPVVEDLTATGTAIIGVSALEDLSKVKEACKDKLTVLGNLNGIEMCRWTTKEAVKNTQDAIAKAGKGGGFILGDNHGEIPWQVSEEVLLAISETVHERGRYPLTGI